MKNFITKENFISPFPYLSKNLTVNEIDNFIYKAQNERLKELLGKELYFDIFNFFQKSAKVTNVTQGVTTLVTLDTLNGLQVTDYITLDTLLGTINTLNQKEFQILSITSNTIEINFNSTGLTYTSGGVAEKFKTFKNFDLLEVCKPFLIYASYAKYLPYSNLKSTNSGVMVHSVGEATQPSSRELGILSNLETQSADYAEKDILEFLNKNQNIYTLYKTTLQGQNNTNILPLYSTNLNFSSGNIS